MSVELAGLDHDSLEKMIGPECYETALEYVRRKAVSQQIWIASQNAREALAIALTGMIHDGEITRARASELAKMALRDNAKKLYGL